MEKLREERFLFPDDNLLKRILTIFEHGSSETLRRRYDSGQIDAASMLLSLAVTITI